MLRLTNWRAGAAAPVGTPGPEGSIGKLAYAELNQRVYEFCVNLLGAERHALRRLHDAPPRRRDGVAHAAEARSSASRANSIEGGTTEMMRNILGERVLGLPGDLRVDKDVPWSAVPRDSLPSRRSPSVGHGGPVA